jgi:YegS/Rv2252/BmrU family lipid kinase
MRKAILLYNPLSGNRHERRIADVEIAANVLRGGGIETVMTATRSPGEAAEQAREAIANGCDVVFACGGDGTIHDVLQGVVGTDAVLGVIPLGTANALAHDLKIPRSPSGAAHAALAGEIRRFSVGRVEFQDFSGNRGSRYFTVAAGVGVDAHLFQSLNPTFKKRHGMAAYYVKAWHLWATYPMPFFSVAWKDAAGQEREESATELLAVRIANFGGVLRSLAPGASLERKDMRLVVCKTASRTAYLRYVFQGLYRSNRNVRGVELAHSEELSCFQPVYPNSSLPQEHKIYIEADGELLGTLPATITMVPEAFSVLVPSGWKSCGRSA